MKFPDPTLLVLMGYEDVPTHIEMMFTGTLIHPVVASNEVPARAYSGCIIVMPRRDTTPDERFRLNAWVTLTVLPLLPKGKSPVYV